MNEVKLGQLVNFSVLTFDPSTGGSINADAAPTWIAWKNGATQHANGTCTLRATGNYYAALATTGLAAGDRIEVIAQATVGGVTAAAVVARFVCVAANASDVKTVADAVKAKTDNLPADPASNTQVATRLAAAGYSPPDNAGIAAIRAKTDNLPAQPAAVGAAMDLVSAPNPVAVAALQAGLSTLTPSQVLTQIEAALNTAIAELGVGAPPAQPTLRQAAMLVYMALRNNSQATSSARRLKNDAGQTICAATTSDDGTFSQGKLGAP